MKKQLTGPGINFSIPVPTMIRKKRRRSYVYSDDPASVTKTKVMAERKNVISSTVPDVRLQASGGQAIRIRQQN